MVMHNEDPLSTGANSELYGQVVTNVGIDIVAWPDVSPQPWIKLH